MGSRMRFLVFAVSLFVFMAGTAGADGFLYVTSSPEKAIVKIDGKTQGAAPVSISLPAGTYSVEASLTSYRSTSQKVAVNEGEVTRIEFKLDKITSSKSAWTSVSASKGKGNITILTDWQPAEIYLDGVKRKEKSPVTIKEIPAGIHWLILTSKDHAIYRELTLQNQETLVVQEYFEKVKAGTYRPWTRGTGGWPNRAAEIEQKRQALPATINLKMTTTQQSSGSSTIWGSSDSVVIAFQYRKSGTETWEKKELQLKTNEEASFTVEKGTYEVQVTATHYKTDTGLITIFTGASKKKVGEAKQQFTKEFAADKLYAYNIIYDGTVTLKYELTESDQNTEIE
ncbi:MAG: PEGA domain-containing protein [Candidatus Omnitrophota bacterium]